MDTGFQAKPVSMIRTKKAPVLHESRCFFYKEKARQEFYPPRFHT